MNYKYLNTIKTSILKEDVFGAHLLVGAEYDTNSEWDIPYVDTPDDLELPEELVGYSQSQYCHNRQNAYLHFYHDDYIFDGPRGIWFTLLFNKFFKNGFNLEKLNGYKAIITPDFSIYNDMPRIMQMWNVLRSRIIGFYLSKIGYSVVVNIRWTDNKSYSYCFAGLRKNNIIAISNLGCIKSPVDRELFYTGLKELLYRIQPKTIILYGTLTSEIEEICAKRNQHYLFFSSEISKAHRGVCNGNESV